MVNNNRPNWFDPLFKLAFIYYVLRTHYLNSRILIITLDAVMNGGRRKYNIWKSYFIFLQDARSKEIEDVLILSGDHLYRMDYMDFVQVRKKMSLSSYYSNLLDLLLTIEFYSRSSESSAEWCRHHSFLYSNRWQVCRITLVLYIQVGTLIFNCNL